MSEHRERLPSNGRDRRPLRLRLFFVGPAVPAPEKAKIHRGGPRRKWGSGFGVRECGELPLLNPEPRTPLTLAKIGGCRPTMRCVRRRSRSSGSFCSRRCRRSRRTPWRTQSSRAICDYAPSLLLGVWRDNSLDRDRITAVVTERGNSHIARPSIEIQRLVWRGNPRHVGGVRC